MIWPPTTLAARTPMDCGVETTPEPVALDLHLTPAGEDPYWVGSEQETAIRYRIEPKVPGVKGLLAKIVGKEPPVVSMWISGSSGAS